MNLKGLLVLFAVLMVIAEARSGPGKLKKGLKNMKANRIKDLMTEDKKDKADVKGLKKNKTGDKSLKGLKKKKANKLKKKNKNNKNKKKNKAATCRDISGTCLQNAYDTIVFKRDKVYNFLKQKTRIIRQLDVKEKKLGKKSEFTDAANVLKVALGGNTTNFTCGVKNKGTMLSNATAAYTLLSACNSTINTACTRNMTIYSTETETLLLACRTKMNTFNEKVVACLKSTTTLTTSTATTVCTCWSEAATQMKAIKALKCDASKSSTAVKKMKNECIATMGVCKKSLQSIPAILYECQVDREHADKTVDEIKSSNTKVVADSSA